MLSHGARICVMLVAARKFAFVWFCLNVGLDMFSSVTTVVESFRTTFVATGVWLFPSVCSYMQSHILNTREPPQATFYSAFIWLFSRMAS